ncbi:uncharacterized protein LOC126851418 [Cataglyphis hispanica]|uniref:uncharacterized protein LOC126851418 n=1 Tax=Cataglyphis hispanica TaxID=1086592 RepID=UPI0021809A97|nr:uncharacterized protein LOC126851418 [Cataglyphis hispanica]XP_050451347.1 uncharacterized protein LOC126851418 [Cataglyphis hispanica]
MKILVLIACVLTIASMVYTDDVKKVQKFGDDLVTCADTLNLPKELSVHVIKCMFENNSLIDEQGVLKKDEILRYFDNIISDQQLQQISSCIDYGQNREESNDKKTLAAIQCIRFKLLTLTKNY